ncbi:MAG TPA: helix-turn-helix transcriptional regulator [Egibacteraceae bacterium]
MTGPPERYRPRPITDVSAGELEPWIEADALRSNATTRLAVWRLRRGVTQRRLAEATGIPLTTYRRLERGELSDPSLRALVNCALALGVDVTDLLEEDWLRWRAPDDERPEPPSPRQLWRRPPGMAEHL